MDEQLVNALDNRMEMMKGVTLKQVALETLSVLLFREDELHPPARHPRHVSKAAYILVLLGHVAIALQHHLPVTTTSVIYWTMRLLRPLRLRRGPATSTLTRP